MFTALNGYAEHMTDPLVFAPGALSPTDGVRKGSAGSRTGLGFRPDREIYSAQHCVFVRPITSWTELSSTDHWLEPHPDVRAVSFSAGELSVMAPVRFEPVSASSPAPRHTHIDGSVSHDRIKKVIVTKPSGLLWDRSDLHVIVGGERTDIAVTIVSVDSEVARRTAARFSAAVAQRRLLEREFIEEHDAEWLDSVAFKGGGAVELDWAWIYTLPAHG